MRVVLRSDASSEVGIGHFVRSFAIGQALRDKDAQVELLTAVDPGSLRKMCEAEGIAVTAIDAVPGSIADARHTRDAVSDGDWLVIDGYQFGSLYRREVRRGAKLAVVNDHGTDGLEADLIINGNLYARRGMYPGARGTLLLGPGYAPLRREVRATRRAEQPGGVVVSLGGADPRSRTLPVLASMSARGIVGAAVIGPMHAHRGMIEAAAKAVGWRTLVDVPDLPSLFAAAEFVVVGAGTATLECAAIGVPMVAVQIAENQTLVADALANEGLALRAHADDPAGVAECAAQLGEDVLLRAQMTGRGPKRVDGMGALRIASAMVESPIRLRPVTLEDAELLYEWLSDPVTRAASFRSAPVPWSRHFAWLTDAMRSSSVAIHIGEVDGKAIGVVRLEREGERATISVTVAPASRGQNRAVPLIDAGLEVARHARVKWVDAFIRQENVPSRRAFASAGFTELTHVDVNGDNAGVRMVADLNCDNP
jgi:spore coat polysaccharide biosynthesis predicted glycosyltransferase SpsG/RimJ/RimL family protein N-acetyltransferase